MDADGLVDHLRSTVVNQVLIDQPNYPGCVAALESGQCPENESTAGR
jgi:hypothetical protein